MNDNEEQFTPWLTKKQEAILNKEFTKMYDRFREDLNDWREKAGGKKRVKIELRDGNIYDPIIIYAEEEEQNPES
jgi:hypothetical protein